MLYPAVVRTLEKYSPQRVRDLIASTKKVSAELRPLIGNRLRETPTTAQISADDILQIAMERGGVKNAPIVPFEATAALCMLLLRDHKMLTVHFVGVPPGGADLLIKFLPPETLARFGGPKKFAQALDTSLTNSSCCASRKASMSSIRRKVTGELIAGEFGRDRLVSRGGQSWNRFCGRSFVAHGRHSPSLRPSCSWWLPSAPRPHRNVRGSMKYSSAASLSS